MNDWLTIDSAPQDGSSVRLKAPWVHAAGGFEYGVGSFREHSAGDPPEWRMHGKDIGWCRANPPTHWQKL